MEMFEFIRNLAQQHETVVPISVFVAILCLCLVIGHLLEENRWVNESITAILIVTFLFLSFVWILFFFICNYSFFFPTKDFGFQLFAIDMLCLSLC